MYHHHHDHDCVKLFQCLSTKPLFYILLKYDMLHFLYLKPHQCYKSHCNVATEWCLIKKVGKRVEILPQLTMWKKCFFQTDFSVKKGLTMDGMSNFESTREQNQVCLDCELFVIWPTFSNYLIWIPQSKWQNTPFSVYSFLGKTKTLKSWKHGRFAAVSAIHVHEVQFFSIEDLRPR